MTTPFLVVLVFRDFFILLIFYKKLRLKKKLRNDKLLFPICFLSYFLCYF